MDFLSLDFFGIELDVLKIMLLKLINIEILFVLCDWCSDNNEIDIIYYLKFNNYKFVIKIENYNMLLRDLIFIWKYMGVWSFCCCWFFLNELNKYWLFFFNILLK